MPILSAILSNMIYGKDYFGFVYIWRDKKRNMYCIGSHLGSLDDGYTSSTGRFPRAYKKRPQDFKRRVLSYLQIDNRKLLQQIEEFWLSQIDPMQLGKRYYNIKRRAAGGYVTEGYTKEQRIVYSTRLSASRSGKKHHAATKVFCIDRVYDTISEAHKSIGWNPIKRINSRTSPDFYRVRDGQPTIEEIYTNTARKRAHNQRLAAINRNLPYDHHKARGIKARDTRRKTCPDFGQKISERLKARAGRQVSIDGVIYPKTRVASEILGIKCVTIVARIKNPNFTTYFYV